MSDPAKLEEYFSIIAREKMHPSAGRLRFYLQDLFADVDLRNSRVLDIGGGSGLFSFYAACMGAEKVVCLEPESEGSSSGMSARFRRVCEELGVGEKATLRPVTIQSFHPGDSRFDVVLLHNSINHLDEPACIHLLEDEKNREIYRRIFARIASLSAAGANLIVCDCSRYNLFARLGIRNPLAPSIEWHKHQAPEVWASLLRDAGFRDPKITWIPLNLMGSLGRFLTNNPCASYCLNSRFCLRMKKTKGGSVHEASF
jgi:SAM-dependent methyltransferase